MIQILLYCIFIRFFAEVTFFTSCGRPNFVRKWIKFPYRNSSRSVISATAVDDVIGVYSVNSTEVEELRTELWKTVLPRVRAEIMQKFSVSQLYPTFPLPVIFISGNQVRFVMKQSPDTVPLKSDSTL